MLLFPFTGPIVEVIVPEENVVNGIFYQDERVKCMIDSPKLCLYIYATYELNDLRIPLYLFLVEDGNSESEVVPLWMLIEDSESICQMVEIFNQHLTRICTLG